jgi:S-DNA-T family DNA segregation ATPase FtsK/SpoIIIE
MVARSLRWALRWIPLTAARVLVWALIALGWLGRHAVVYCVGYRDYAALVADAAATGRPAREHVLRTRWRRAALRRTLTLPALAAALYVAALQVVDRYGQPGEAGLILGGVAVLAGIGRALRPGLWAPAPRQDNAAGTPVADAEDARAPYPLADARTRAEAADCVGRALGAEGIALRLCEEARRTGWGWEIPVILRSGTPAAIVAKAGDLETHLDLPAGGALVTPDRTRRARVVLRLAHTDPFAHLGDAPARAALSATITARAVIGARIDGQPLAVPLAGVHGVVIGSSGAGKSSTLLALADAVTACADALVWDIDPAGPGLDALGGAIARRERDKAGIEDALADALALAEVRPRMLRTLGMGAQWNPTPERPALVVIVDEYPRLSPRAKELAVALLRVGRKARVSLILASTEATSDALGAAIADTTALRILHPCRHTDVRLVLGPQMAAEGWRPDRLRPATADDPGDVGTCYVATAGLTEPLVSKIAPLSQDEAGERGHQRATAGLARIDGESWQRARAQRAAHRGEEDTGRRGGSGGGSGGGGESDRGPLGDTRVRDDVISVFGLDERLWTEDILTRLVNLDERYTDWTADDLAAALRPFGVMPVQIKRDGTNRRGYDKDTLQRTQDGQGGGNQ